MVTFEIGDVRITRLPESAVGGPMGIFLNEAAINGTFDEVLGPVYYDAASGLTTQPSSCWLIRDGETIALVDAGPGDMPRLGMREFWSGWPAASSTLIAGLDREGVSAEDVDYVLLTHLHFDHVGGLVRTAGSDRVPAFPNARHIFSKLEYLHAVEESNAGRLPDFMRRIFEDCVQRVVDAGLVEMTSGEQRLTTSIGAVPSPGHSPGHLRFDVASNGENAIFSGDAFHYPFQVAQPDSCLLTAHDPEQDRRSRRRLFDDAVQRDALIFPTHLAEPWALRVAPDGESYVSRSPR